MRRGRGGGSGVRRLRRVNELTLSVGSSDEQPSSTFIHHKPKYRVGVRVRKNLMKHM